MFIFRNYFKGVGLGRGLAPSHWAYTLYNGEP